MRVASLFTATCFVAITSWALPPNQQGVSDSALKAGKRIKKEKLIPLKKAPQLRVSVGASYRSLGGVSWDTGSHVSVSSLPLTPSETGTVGVRGQISDRVYSDGFVRPDIGTGIDGQTGYFGYTQTSQVQGGFLVMHGSGGTIQSLSAAQLNADGSTGLDGFAPTIAVDFSALEYARGKDVFRIGLHSDVSLFSLDSSRSADTFVARFESVAQDVTDRYDLKGALLPSPPYSGSFSGSVPLINNVPDERLITPSNVVSSLFKAQVRQDLDLFLIPFSLGPTIEWQRDQRWSLQLGFGLALNIASWKATQTETLQQDGRLIGTFVDRDTGTDVLPGVYLQATARMHLKGSWWLTAYGRYDWCRTLEGDIGPSHFSADLSGWTVGTALEYRF